MKIKCRKFRYRIDQKFTKLLWIFYIVRYIYRVSFFLVCNINIPSSIGFPLRGTLRNLMSRIYCKSQKFTSQPWKVFNFENLLKDVFSRSRVCTRVHFLRVKRFIATVSTAIGKESWEVTRLVKRSRDKLQDSREPRRLVITWCF